jgi:hypothetical protein
MRDFLSFTLFSLLEAKTTTHFRERLAERTFEQNVHLGLPKKLLDNFSDQNKVKSNLKKKIAQLAEDKTYALFAKTYEPHTSQMAMLLDPKVEYKGEVHNITLHVTAKDKKGQDRTLTGPYWAIVFDNRLLTTFNREDKGDELLIEELKQHLKREDPELYPSIQGFGIDRKTADPVTIIKLDDNGEVIEETPKHVAINFKEFQTVIRPGLEITYFGFGPDKSLIKKTATIESISKLDGKAIDPNHESDVTPGIKVYFTNKASKSFVPNKDVLIIDGHKAEITRIFLDKRMANPINFMLKVKSVSE